MPASEQTPRHHELSVEDRRVVEWRHAQFSALGFDEEELWLLVDSGADLQLARSLVAAGCPLHLVLRIVL